MGHNVILFHRLLQCDTITLNAMILERLTVCHIR